jgi:hypothetical protein
VQSSRSLRSYSWRAVMGWSVSFEGVAIPVWASWIASVVAGGLAWLGFTASK